MNQYLVSYMKTTKTLVTSIVTASDSNEAKELAIEEDHEESMEISYGSKFDYILIKELPRNREAEKRGYVPTNHDSDDSDPYSPF